MRDRKFKPMSVLEATRIAEERPGALVLPAPEGSGLDLLVVVRRAYEARFVWNAGGFTPHERHENVTSSQIAGLDLTGRGKLPKAAIQWRERFQSVGGVLIVAPSPDVLASFICLKG